MNILAFLLLVFFSLNGLAQVPCSSASVSFQEGTKKSYLDLAKVLDEGLRPLYFEKYHINEFLREASEKAPQQKQALEESLNKNLLNIKPKTPKSLVGMDVKKNGAFEADLNLAISQVFTQVGNEIPAIKTIADNSVVKLGMNANVDPTGGQVGQKKNLSIETAGNPEVHSGLTYSTCDKSSRVMNLGSKSGCPYEKRLDSNFETKVVENLYVGGKLSTSGPEIKVTKPDGYLFFRLDY
ncbi:MAG: hypothetical protein ACXVB1_13545 [Pseudobdellovibrionaceae bacterium]